MTESLNFSKEDPPSTVEVTSWLASAKERLLIEVQLERKQIEKLQNALSEEQKRLDVARMRLELSNYRLEEQAQRLKDLDDDDLSTYVSRTRGDDD